VTAIDPPSLTTPTGSVEPDRRAELNRRIRWFVAATIAYNVIEAVIAIAAGTVASSAALIGFGLDSMVEVTSAAAVAWQFTAKDPETREKTALRIIAFSFFGLAIYVTIDAARTLLGTGEAQPSTVGLVLAAVSLLIMPLLSYGQRRAGRELGSRSAVADSKQTLLCTYLSAVLLVGLGLNTMFGWAWADPIAALVIAAVAVKEGREAWKGDSCCAPTLPTPIRTASGGAPLVGAPLVGAPLVGAPLVGAPLVGAAIDPAATAPAATAACGDGCCAPTSPGTAERS